MKNKKKYQAFFRVAPVTAAPCTLLGYAVICADRTAVFQSKSEDEAKECARYFNRALTKWRKEYLP